MKELEALKKLEDDLTDETYEHQELFTIIEKSLTPPTSEEVCAKLSEELGGKVTYDSGEFELVYDDVTGYTQTVCSRENNRLRIALIMKPSTIKILARFYENEVKGE